MALKISGSGLRYGHLKCVFKRDGAEGLSNLLRSKYDGRIRITTRAAIITALIAHFTENV